MALTAWWGGKIHNYAARVTSEAGKKAAKMVCPRTALMVKPRATPLVKPVPFQKLETRHRGRSVPQPRGYERDFLWAKWGQHLFPSCLW
jgi:hypothetical protein